MSVESLRAPVPATAPEHAVPEPSEPTARLRSRLRLAPATTAAALVLLALVSLWLRTRALSVHYWIDEALSVGISSHPLSDLPALLRQDGSPPLYYVLLHFWISLRGSGETATHELSLLFALLTIPVAYWAGSSLFDRRTGVICAVLAAGMPYLTAYAQETRMYALLALLGLIVAASFVHVFVRRRRRYLPLFSVSLAASLYTHNWALFLGLVAFVAFLVCACERRADRRSMWRDGILAFGAVALMYAPWVPTLMYQARHTGAPWALAPVLWSVSQGVYSLAGGRGAAVALLLGGGAGLVTLRGVRRQSESWLAAVSLLILGFGTLLVAWAYAKTTPAWANRYLAVIVGPLLLAFGFGLARGGRLAMTALALTACFWVLDPMPHGSSAKSNVAAVAAALRPHLGRDPLVVSSQPEQVPTLTYYMPGVTRFLTPLGRVPDPRVVDWVDALSRFRHARPDAVLRAAVGALAPGQQVVLVTPVRFQKTPLWMKLIWADSEAWIATLKRDPRLKIVATSVSQWPSAGIPVRGTVFVRR